MSLTTQIFIVNNIKIPVNASQREAFSLARSRLKRLGIDPRELSFSVFRRSVDARRKENIKFVYSIAASGQLPRISESKLAEYEIGLLNEPKIEEITHGSEHLGAPPLIVGAGPAGLFAALFLAERGYAPTVIERGGCIADRKRAVSSFYKTHILDENSNIQFGEGGAGTFSDGKLVTRINDPLSSYVLSRFVDFGAPEEIKYLARPHIGTDVLSPVIQKMTERIKELGGRVLYNTRYISSKNVGGESVAVTDRGVFRYGALILAIGHSARDTYSDLIESGYSIEGKPFSIGARIEHLAIDIDKALYGDYAGSPELGHAEYNLSHNTKERGVYTFCMCPGGEVVAAASENGGLVVNGMSKHSRSGINSNSAVVCSIFKEDYGSTPLKAIEFQRRIERAAFTAGGGGYSAPMITVGDLLSDRCSSDPTRIIPTYMDGSNYKIARMSEYLPDFVCTSIKNALLGFDKKIRGFADPTAILTGAETRTSAPVRILRDADTRIAIGQNNVYPCGEGAGYAGGITSAAIDGIKTAISIIKRYKPTKIGG